MHMGPFLWWQAQYWANAGLVKAGEAAGAALGPAFAGQGVTTGAAPGPGSQRSPTVRPPLPPIAGAAAAAKPLEQVQANSSACMLCKCASTCEHGTS